MRYDDDDDDDDNNNTEERKEKEKKKEHWKMAFVVLVFRVGCNAVASNCHKALNVR